MSPRLPRVTPAELLRALRRAGWQEFRQTGSHCHLTHPEKPGRIVTVAVHAGQTVPVGTLKAILDQAGLTANELRDLLSEMPVRRYTVILEYDPEATAYSVTVPALPGCTSQGATVEDALANAKEAVSGHVAALEALGESVPEETDGPMVIVASVAA